MYSQIYSSLAFLMYCSIISAFKVHIVYQFITIFLFVCVFWHFQMFSKCCIVWLRIQLAVHAVDSTTGVTIMPMYCCVLGPFIIAPVARTRRGSQFPAFNISIVVEDLQEVRMVVAITHLPTLCPSACVRPSSQSYLCSGRNSLFQQ